MIFSVMAGSPIFSVMAGSPIHANSLSHLFRRVNQEFCFEESILEIYFGHDYSVCNLQQTTGTEQSSLGWKP